jgi:hypothetical protein
LELASPGGLARLEQRALEEARASVDPPRTLSELQTQPTANASGYDLHHIVQQNSNNVAKSPAEFRVEKFGWNAIDAPSNTVWIPRLKHNLITAYYNGKAVEGSGARLRRQIVGDEDFASQYSDGLATLQMFGVLQ